MARVVDGFVVVTLRLLCLGGRRKKRGTAISTPS
jgi:hypothetical protein